MCFTVGPVPCPHWFQQVPAAPLRLNGGLRWPSVAGARGHGDFMATQIHGSRQMLHLHLNGGLEVCKSPFPNRKGLMVVLSCLDEPPQSTEGWCILNPHSRDKDQMRAMQAEGSSLIVRWLGQHCLGGLRTVLCSPRT